MFSCLPEDSDLAADYVPVGELRINPGNLVRPLVVARHQAEEWFDSMDSEQVNIRHRGRCGDQPTPRAPSWSI
jgi:hypothetical protein